MSLDQQVALARPDPIRSESSHLSRAARQVVPPFLQKLYEYVDFRVAYRTWLTRAALLTRIVNDPKNDELIRWSENGDSFYGAFRWTDTTYGCHNARISP